MNKAKKVQTQTYLSNLFDESCSNSIASISDDETAPNDLLGASWVQSRPKLTKKWLKEAQKEPNLSEMAIS